jgi:hypothetical protein
MTAPMGIDQIPKTCGQGFNAVICILQALKVLSLSPFPLADSDSRVQVMHSEPSSVYHLDLRYPNVLKKYDRDDWFLIDWSDANTSPTCAVTRMSKLEQLPRVRVDNHGAEVDIWGESATT